MKSITHYSLLILLCLISFTGCSRDTAETESNALFIDPATRNFDENPELLERIKSGPHGYFRFINIPFSREICSRFSEVLVGAPELNLHGDAHIEQYAVTDLGRGLTDFDDSATGPGIIDLMRFGVSMQLLCRTNGWSENAHYAFERFLQGYRDALNDPEHVAPEPQVVTRMRSKFKSDRKGYLAWVDSIMQPMPDEDKDSLLIAMRPYVENMLAENKEINRDYFKVGKMGYLRMGIGSALDIKYLVQVKGKSDDPNDDIILECKQVRDLSGIDCVNSGQRINPFRILLGQARIAYQPFHHLGYFEFHEYNFWVHSWVDNYKEVKMGETFTSFEELLEVAYDVGVQLGRGHVKHIGAPFGLQIRRKQDDLVASHKDELLAACQNLAGQTVAAWQMFRKNLGDDLTADN